MGGFGEELGRSAREALAIATGETKPARVRRLKDDELRARMAPKGTPAPAMEIGAGVKADPRLLTPAATPSRSLIPGIV